MALLLSRASGSADVSVEADATCTQFNCLSLLAHLLNEQVVARMQSAAKVGPKPNIPLEFPIIPIPNSRAFCL